MLLAYYFSISLITLALIVAVIIGLIQFNKIQALYKCLYFYLCLAFVFNIISVVVGFRLGNNMVVVQIYGFFELLTFTLIYRFFLLKKLAGNILLFVGIIGMAYILLENTLIDFYDLKTLQYYSRAIDPFTIVLASLFFFAEKLGQSKEINKSNMILNAVVLVYFSLNLIMILPINYLVNADTELKFYFLLSNAFVTTLFYIYLTYSLWKNGKIQKPLRTGLEL
ncbi:MAG: hypothetical protein IT222_10655 [Crocinitomix sp.]|nr:hypothetical protein [Crocinitomix sp.]